MHYTLQSGVRSNTITSRCPTCSNIKHRNQDEMLDDIDVCCSIDCYDIYLDKLMTLYNKAMQWADSEGISCTNINKVNAYLIEVGI